MSILKKNILFTYIPASPGTPGDPGDPGRPAYCARKSDGSLTTETASDVWEDWDCQKVINGTISASSTYTTTVVSYSIVPVYSTASSSEYSLVQGGGSTVVGYVSVPTYQTVTVATDGASGVKTTGTTSTTTSSTSSSTAEKLAQCISYWNSTGTVIISKTYTSSGQWTGYYNYCYPEIPARPASPASPPTAAQLMTNFQEGWNASAQSIESLLPGKAALYRVLPGARGVLLGFAPEPWVPTLSRLPFGIMYADGGAKVFENGGFKENLGYFFSGQEFIIGRTLDNYIMYINKTDGQTIARRRSPAAPSTPIHLFAVLYYGGDTVWI